MIELTPDVRDAMVAHALSARPLEACGMFSARAGSRLIDEFHPLRNIAESATIFQLDPQGMLDLEQRCHQADRELIGVMHSHVDSSPYPSPTDVQDSGRYDPDGSFFHMIVSLRHAEPALRCYRISDATVTEELVVIAGDEPTVHDQAGAVAAVVSLRKPPPE